MLSASCAAGGNKADVWHWGKVGLYPKADVGESEMTDGMEMLPRGALLRRSPDQSEKGQPNEPGSITAHQPMLDDHTPDWRILKELVAAT